MKKFLGYCLSAKSNDGCSYLYVNEWGGVVLCENTILFPSKEAANGALRYISLTQYIEKYETLCAIPVIQDESGERIALHDMDVKFCIIYGYTQKTYPYHDGPETSCAMVTETYDPYHIDADDIPHCCGIIKEKGFDSSHYKVRIAINGEPQLDFEPIEIQ